MGRDSIRSNVLMEVIADLPRSFATKDVSEDERVRGAHPEAAAHSHYHAFVGGALSDHSPLLGIKQIRKSTSRGAIWEKQGTASIEVSPQQAREGTPIISEATSEQQTGLGPQCHGDSPFKARMRLHQSWYRSSVLGLPCGTGPLMSATSHYGNMLTQEDGTAGRNFLTTEIAHVARDRVAQGGGAVETFRLFHNMLSSQPMCFNLFGPLLHNRELARELAASLVPEELGEVTRVSLEWAPEPAEDYLADQTAFDAFIEYRDLGGRLCALGIETKLTEPFSPHEYDGESYRRWMRVPDAPWRPEAASLVHDISHNQLWRDHLLAVALRNHPRSPYSVARLMLVRHPDDHDCAHVLGGYQRLLRVGDDTLLDMSLDRLVGAWQEVADDQCRDWLNAFRLRYLDLERSEGKANA